MTRPGRGALVVAGLLAATACGQLPGTHDPDADGLPPIIIEQRAGGAELPTDFSVVDPVDEGEPGAGPTASTVAGPGATVATTRPPGGDGGTEFVAQGTDRTGVADDVIRLGLHAPVTGAAPLPSQSFNEARDLYWRWVTEIRGERVLGRSRVEVPFKDDRYRPSTAIQACRELAADTFLVVGAGGTDQIQACGQFAGLAEVPYLSFGVTEAGLRGNPWYFATSMSYRQQGELLARYVGANFGDAKVAAIVTDTPNFDDAVAGWESGVELYGIDYEGTLRHPRGNDSWITSFVRDLQQADVEVVYILSAPTDYIRFAQQATSQEFFPQYVGVGISMGLNAVLGAGCPHVDGGRFFSPFPGLDWAETNAPEYFQAADDLGVNADDIGFALWGLAKTQHAMLQRYEQVAGTDLTREDFRVVLENGSGLISDVLPALSYQPDDHFGAAQVHLLEADCSVEQYRTLATFASGF